MIPQFENFVPAPSDDPYVQQLHFITSFTSGKQKQYYEWLLTQVQRVEIQDLGPLRRELGISASWVKRRCKLKACFMNAALVSQLHPEIKYVEGTLMIGGQIPTEHAWNSYQGVHFDVTDEFLLGNRQDPHYQLLEYDSEQLWAELEKTKMYGDLVRLHFVNYIEK